MYCSRQCRNTANSRAGAPIRSRKAKERVHRGDWINPLTLEPVPARREHARKAGLARAEQHRAALAKGEWQNPANAPGAREKLSRPRKHDNPTLHAAIEKLGAGYSMANLAPEEQEAYRAYRRDLRLRRRQEPDREDTKL